MIHLQQPKIHQHVKSIPADKRQSWHEAIQGPASHQANIIRPATSGFTTVQTGHVMNSMADVHKHILSPLVPDNILSSRPQKNQHQSGQCLTNNISTGYVSQLVPPIVTATHQQRMQLTGSTLAPMQTTDLVNNESTTRSQQMPLNSSIAPELLRHQTFEVQSRPIATGERLERVVNAPSRLPHQQATQFYRAHPFYQSQQPSTHPPHGTGPLFHAPFQQSNYYQNPPVPQPVNQLTDEQYAARQVMSRDLPTFSGRPEEWPIFISSYENSTTSCGFTHTENLIPLQRALNGKALEAVSFRLLLPAAVPGVIETLRLLFGRPELILHDILEKVRGESAPRADKLESLIQYSLVVQNMVCVMEAANLTLHLYNLLLLQELVNKLPAAIKLQWAMYGQTIPSACLSKFSMWLHQLAMAASTVTSPPSYQPSEKSSEKRADRSKGQVNAHALLERETDSTMTPAQWVEEFEKITRNERWEKVKQHPSATKFVRISPPLGSRNTFRSKQETGHICFLRRGLVAIYDRRIHSKRIEPKWNAASALP